MSKLADIAFRNIFRNRRRTIITEITIIIGLVVLILVIGILKNMEIGWRDSIILSSLGHVQVQALGLKEDNSLKHAIRESTSVYKKLSSYSSVESVSMQISVGGLISTGDDSTFFFGSGVDPDEYVHTLPKTVEKEQLVEGAFFMKEDTEGAVIAQGLAKKFKLQIGDRLFLAANDKYNAFNAVDIVVTGILNVSDEYTNEHLVLFNIDNARTLTGFSRDECSSFVIRLKEIKSIQGFIKYFETLSLSREVSLYTWKDLAGEFNSVMAIFNAISIVLVVILLVLTLIAIMNTILMSTFERVREIGTSMALGASEFQIISIFIYESVFIGIIGVVIGDLLGLGISLMVNAAGGLHFPSPPGETVPLVLKLDIMPVRIVLVSCFILAVSFLASLYPACYASRLQPVKALKQD